MVMGRDKDDWEDVLDDLEEEAELEFEEVEPEIEKRDESFYASRLELIEEAARKIKSE
jgi:hypothetical protein